MKRSVLETLHQVFSAVICAFPGGRGSAAAQLGYESKRFDNHAYENAGIRPLSNDQIHQLETDAGTTLLPEFIAHLHGGMFVPLAHPDTLDNVDLYSRAVKSAAKRGIVDQSIHKALEDGVIEPDEAKYIMVAHTPLPGRLAVRGAGHHSVALQKGSALSTYKLVCPRCSGKMRIRTSEGTHIFLSIAYLQCVNEACS